MSLEHTNPHAATGGTLAQVGLEAEVLLRDETTGDLWSLTIDLLECHQFFRPVHRLNFVKSPDFPHYMRRQCMSCDYILSVDFEAYMKASKIPARGTWGDGRPCTYQKLDPSDRRVRFLNMYAE